MSNGPSFTIRRLTDADIDPCREWLAVLGEAFGEPETYTAAQPGSG